MNRNASGCFERAERLRGIVLIHAVAQEVTELHRRQLFSIGWRSPFHFVFGFKGKLVDTNAVGHAFLFFIEFALLPLVMFRA